MKNGILLISASALILTFSASQAAPIIKAGSGTELTDPNAWTGSPPAAPAAGDDATWNATSLTGTQTLGSVATWRSVNANAASAALTLNGSALTLSGATLGNSFDVLLANSAQPVTITNDLFFTGIVSNAAVPAGTTTAARIQISGGSGGLTLGNITYLGGTIANDANLFLRGGTSSTINGTVTVDGQLGKGDAGTWTLNGANTIGWVYINNGTMRAGHNNAFGTGTIFISGGGGTTTLSSADGTARTFSNFVDFRGGNGGLGGSEFNGTLNLGQTTGGTGTLTFAGDMHLGTASGRTIATVVDTTFSGVLSGTGGFIKSGTGTLTLTNTNTLSGIVSINAGVLAAGSDTVFGASQTGSAQIKMNGGTLASTDTTARTFSTGKSIDFAFGSTFGTASTGDLKFNDPINIGNGQKTATINNAVTEFAGVISNGTGAPTELFTKAGSGTLILSGNNNYARPTHVAAGRLIVNGSQTIATGLITVAAGASVGGTGTMGGALEFDGASNLYVADLSDALTVASIKFTTPGFGVDNLQGIDWSTISLGTYTVLGGTLNPLNLDHFGSDAAYNVGFGKEAFFQDGSLQLVVRNVPEPSVTLLGLIGALALNRRRRA